MLHSSFHSQTTQLFLFVVLEEKLEKLRVENDVGSLTELIKDLHVYPDFHGNTVFSFLIYNVEEKLFDKTFGFQETGLLSLIRECKDLFLVFHL